jgi:hypothetical protein
VNLPGQFVGPLGALAGGCDLSVPVSFVVGGMLYLAMLWRFPEPDAVHGPQGRRLIGAPRERDDDVARAGSRG